MYYMTIVMYVALHVYTLHRCAVGKNDFKRSVYGSVFCTV